MEQKIMSSVVFWDPRQVVLTDSHLILSKTSEPEKVTDVIGLHEVLNVFSDVNDEGKMHQMLVEAGGFGGGSCQLLDRNEWSSQSWVSCKVSALSSYPLARCLYVCQLNKRQGMKWLSALIRTARRSGAPTSCELHNTANSRNGTTR